MEKYLEAKKILMADYKNIMSAYSLFCTQIEIQEELDAKQVSAKAAYYTVVWRLTNGDPPMLSSVERHIKTNLDSKLSEIDNELAIAILIESRIHDLEAAGLAKIKRSEDGATIVSLTDRGKDLSNRLRKDIRDSE